WSAGERSRSAPDPRGRAGKRGEGVRRRRIAGVWYGSLPDHSFHSPPRGPMSRTPHTPAVDRRTFLQTIAAIGGGALATACARNMPSAFAASGAAVSSGSMASLRDRIGLQLFTVRDRLPADYPGTLLAVARIGYKEVQPTTSYGT